MLKYYSAIIAITVFSMLLMIVFISSNNNMKRKKKSGFILAYTLVIIVATFEYLGVILNYVPNSLIELHYVVKFAELSITPTIPIIIALNIFKQRKSDTAFVSTFIIVHTMLEFFSMFYGFIYTVDNTNQYKHGKFYFIYIIACFMSLCILFVFTRRFSKAYQSKNEYLMILVMTFLILGISVQFADSNVKTDWLTVAIGSIFIYIYYSDVIQYIDGLTKLLNQNSYKNYCGNIAQQVIIIVMDVDDFKGINDTFGHQVGDYVLLEIAKLVRECYGKYGTCFRIGGDEFCVIIESQLDKIREINDGFYTKLEEKQKEAPNIPFVSMGYSMYNPEFDILADSVNEADKNMYKLKEWNKKNKNK